MGCWCFGTSKIGDSVLNRYLRLLRRTRLRAPLEDALVVVVDEDGARPGRLVAARQDDYPLAEGVEPSAIRERARCARGDHDTISVVERDKAAVVGSVVYYEATGSSAMSDSLSPEIEKREKIK